MADVEGGEVLDLEEGGDELDPLAGSELFDIPEDLQDVEPEPGAQTGAEKSDPAQAVPPDGKKPAEQPRDPVTKQFVKADGAPATEEGQPPEPPQAGEAADPATAGAPPEEAEPELEFSFRADGQAIPIKGSKVTKDGIFIPAQYMSDVQRLMSHGVVYQGSFKQRLYEAKKEVEETKAQVNEDVERARATLQFFANLFERQKAGEPAVEEWLDDFGQNLVKLEAEATLEIAKAYRERKPAEVKLDGFEDEPAQGAANVRQYDPEELSQQLAPELTTRLQNVMRTENIRGLTGAEVTRIRDWMVDPANMDQFFKQALADIPKEESGLPYDIKKGQIVPLDDAIAAVFKHQARLILDARRSAADLAAAEARNRANGNGSNRIPPTTAVAGKGAPAGPQKPPSFKTKAEMEAWFNSEDPLK